MTRSRASRVGKTTRRLVTLLSIYLVASCLGHYLVWPEPAPAATEMPRDGDVIVNRPAGERITFVQARRSSGADSVILAVDLQPGGAIPFPHIHGATREIFEVVEGELTMQIDGVDRVLKAGQRLVVEPGIAHQPRNDSGAPARISVYLEPNAGLDLCLVQLHGFMDDPDRAKHPLAMLLQLVALSQAYDIQLPWVPVWIQHVATFLAAPSARLLGYRTWQSDYLALAHQRGVESTHTTITPPAEARRTAEEAGS